MTAPTTRGSDKFIVRLPDGMRDRIKAAAEVNNRSMNAEIVAALEEKYPAPPPDDDQRNLVALFETLPKKEQEAFIFEYLERLGVTDQDIADGLFPGIRLKNPAPNED